MHTIRQETEFGTELIIFTTQEALERRDVWQAYRVTCADFDYDHATDKRQPPTARVSLMSATRADAALTRQLAAEYTAVADAAEALQAEKRAAYAERFGGE